MFRMASLRHPVFLGISAFMHVNGQFFCSRQKLSSFIHGGNNVLPWVAMNDSFT
jgi:hypothetical protein